MLALKEFANFVTLNMANLAATYARLLAENGKGYETIHANSRRASARRLLKAVIEAYELGTSDPLCHLFDERTNGSPRWANNKIEPPQPFLEVECLGQTLTPVVTSLEAGKFLWQILSEVRTTILRAPGSTSVPSLDSPIDGGEKDVSKDTTEHRQVAPEREKAIREEEVLLDEFHAVLDTIEYGVLLMDSDLRTRIANRAFKDMWGFPEDFIARRPTLAELINYNRDTGIYDVPRDEWEAYVEQRVEAARQGATAPMKFRRRDGRILSYQGMALPGGGRMLTYFDITELEELVKERTVELEREVAERKQVEEALAHERDLLQALMDNSPDYLFFKDRESRFIRTNKAHAQLLLNLTDPQEAVGITDFDLFPHEDAQRFYDEEQHIMQSRQPVVAREWSLPSPSKAGETVWLSEHKVPITDETGQVVGLVGISRDVTERKQAEEALVKRAVELETVAQVSTVAATILEVDKLLPEVVDLTKERFGLYHAHIYLLDEISNTLNLAAGAGEVGQQMVAEGWSIPLEQEQSLVAQAARTGQGLIVNDVRENPDWLPNPLLPDTRSEMAVPMIVGGLVLGVLDVQAEVANRFTDEDVRIQTTLATQVAVALQNANQYEQARQATSLLGERVKELNCLNEIGREMEEVPPLPELLQWVTERIPPAMQYPDLCVAAIEFDDHVYGLAEAMDLPTQMTHGLYIRGQIMGRLYIAYTEKQDFLNEESAMLGAIASRLSGYIENRRLFEETETALAEAENLAKELAVLNELGQALTARLGLREVLDETYRQVSRLVDATNFYIGLYNPKKDEVAFLLNVSQSKLDRQITVMPASEGIGGYIIRNRTSLLFEDNIRQRQQELGIEMVGEAALSWLGVPLMIGDQALGVMAVQSHTTPRLYDKHDRELLTAIANQAAIAIQNARQFEETQAALVEVQRSRAEAESRLQETQTLQQLTQALSGTLQVDEVIDAFFQACTRLLGADFAIFSLVDKRQQRVKAVAGLNVTEDHIKRADHPLDSDDIMADIIRTGRTDIITGWDHRFDPENFEAEGMAEWGLRIFTPLTLRQEHIGLVEVGFKEDVEAAVRESHVELLRTLIDQTAIALERSRLFEQAQRRARELAVIQAVIAAVNATDNVLKSLPEVTEYLRDLMPLDVITLSAYTPGEPEYEVFAFGAEVEATHFAQRGIRLPVEGTCPGWVITHNDAWLEEDFREAKSFMEDEQLVAEGLASRLMLPLRLKRQVIGTLNLGSAQPGAFNETHLPPLWQIADQMAMALERSRLFEQIQRRARREQTIRQITEKMRAAASLEQLIKTAAEELGQRFSAEYTLVELGLESESPQSGPGLVPADNGSKSKKEDLI
jgi:PAS domain S-box-containing protein